MRNTGCNAFRLIICVSVAFGFSSSYGQSSDAEISAIKRGDALFDAGDYKRSLEEYQRLAVEGNGPAMFRIGSQFARGQGGRQSYAFAKGYWEKGAMLGNASSMEALGDLFRDGNGVSRNIGTALRWYGEAAKRGNSDAMVDVAQMLTSLNKPDYATAALWAKAGADWGNPAAMNLLGVYYSEGRGVSQNKCTAETWYQRAIKTDEKYGPPVGNLGLSVYWGACGKADKTKGKTLMRAAVSLGDFVAANNLASLEEAEHPTQRSTYVAKESDGNDASRAIFEQQRRDREYQEYNRPRPSPPPVPAIAPLYEESHW